MTLTDSLSPLAPARDTTQTQPAAAAAGGTAAAPATPAGGAAGPAAGLLVGRSAVRPVAPVVPPVVPPVIPPVAPAAPPVATLVAGFWMGGFEGADHVNAAGQALDMAVASGHIDCLDQDFARAAAAGLTVVRESIGWRLAEPQPGVYDLRRALRVEQAAARHGLQVLWTLMHYGLPADLSLHDDRLIDRFADFAAAVAGTLGQRGGHDPVYTPINEIGFLAWCASQSGMLAPPNNTPDDVLNTTPNNMPNNMPDDVPADAPANALSSRLDGSADAAAPRADHAQAGSHPGHADSASISGYAVKRRLARAALAAMAAMRRLQPNARFMHVEPLVHVVAPPGRPELEERAQTVASWQWQAWDLLAGRCEPELGGSPAMLDLLGVNHYHSSQWELETERRLRWHEQDPRRRPLHALLAQAWQRYGVPLVLAETSHVGVGRAAWLHDIAAHVRQARADGVPVQGLCLYPLIDRPDWHDLNHWHRSGLWHVPSAALRSTRVIDPAYRAALQAWQAVLPGAGAGAGAGLDTRLVPESGSGLGAGTGTGSGSGSGSGWGAGAGAGADTDADADAAAAADADADGDAHGDSGAISRASASAGPGLAGPAAAAALPARLPTLVMLAAARWGDHPRRAQQLATRLAGRWHVVYVEPPRPDAGSDALHTSAAAPDVTVVVQHLRMPQPPAALAAALRAGAWAAPPDVVWIESPDAWPLAQALGVPTLVCDVQPPAQELPPRAQTLQPQPWLAWLAAWQAPCAHAQLVLAPDPHAAAHLPCAADGQVQVLGPGVDLAAFAQHLPQGWDEDEAARLQPAAPGLRVGFIGEVDGSVDLMLLQALAAARPAWQWLVCGARRGVPKAQLPRLANLHWLGEPPRRIVPALMRGWQVAMLPLRVRPGAGSPAAGIAQLPGAAVASGSGKTPVLALSTPGVLDALASGLPVVSASVVGGLPAGHRPAGDLAAGDLLAGDVSTGNVSMGNVSTGHAPTAHLPSGSRPMDDAQLGDAPVSLLSVATNVRAFLQACDSAAAETPQQRMQRLRATQAVLAGRDWSRCADQVHGWLLTGLLASRSVN